MTDWINVNQAAAALTVSQIAEMKQVADTLADALSRSTAASSPHAYVTLASPDYEWGLRVLLRSLRRVSPIPIIVLAAQRWSMECTEPNVLFVHLPSLSNAAYNPARHEFGATLTKLWTFGLTPFRRITFLDADLLILKPIDDLFERTGFWAASDYVEESARRGFNSGLMSFEPTRDLRDRIFENAATARSFDQGDQGLLNTLLWPEVHTLPAEYSLLRHYDFFGGVDLKRDLVRSIHFINKKPWELWYRESADAALSDLDDLWTKQLSHDELLALVSTWRRRQYIAERARFESRTDPRAVRRQEVLRRRRVQRRALIAIGVLLAVFFFAIGFLVAGLR